MSVKNVQPDNRPLAGSMYVLCGDFRLKTDKLDVVVKKGFLNDGGSVPRWAWSLIGLTPDGIARAAYLVHDWLYRFGLESRLVADQTLRDVMRMYGVSKIRSQIAYLAVRVGGRKHYGNPVPPNSGDFDSLYIGLTNYYKAGVLDTQSYNFAIHMLHEFDKV